MNNFHSIQAAVSRLAIEKRITPVIILDEADHMGSAIKQRYKIGIIFNTTGSTETKKNSKKGDSKMAKLGSGYRQMETARKMQGRQTDKFMKDAKTSIKKSVKLFKGSGFFSSIANGILWCIKAVFLLTWWMFKFILWCWYMMLLCVYHAVKSMIQNKKKNPDDEHAQ